MAIARGNYVSEYGSAGSGSSLTRALDVGSGDDRFIIASGMPINPVGIDTSAMTYNGTSMSQIATYSPQDLQTNVPLSMWYLANPSSGTNNVVWTYTTTATYIGGIAVAYSGVDASSPGATNGGLKSGTPQTVSVTTTASNSWVVAVQEQQDTYSSWSGDAVVVTHGAFASQGSVADTNAAISSASTTVDMTFNWTGTGNGNKSVMIVMELLEAGGSATTVKTWDAVARANVKTLNGVASASIKTIIGVT